MAEPLDKRQKASLLIYRPPPRWYFWTAFGAALAIHLTAVAASQRHEAPPVDLPPQPPQVVEAVLAPPETDSAAGRHSDSRAASSAGDSTGVCRRKNTATAATAKRGKNSSPIKTPGTDVDVASESPRHIRAASTVPLRGSFTARHRQWSDRLLESDSGSGNVTSCFRLVKHSEILSWITPPLARFGSGDLDLEQFPRLTFPSPSP